MVEKSERKVLRMLCASIALDFIGGQDTGQYKELERFLSYPTLNVCLKELLDHRLIEPYLERIEKKREWYELTIKRTLQCAKLLLELPRNL
jgi:hypothetical protein